MSFDEDPEVVADLQLRAATERDRTRTRGVGAYDWQAPTAVTRWPCRGGCQALIDVTDEATHALDVYNRELARRGEALLDTSRTAFCNACRERGAAIAADRNRKHVEAVAKLVVELKTDPGPMPEREWEIINNLRLMHHPDVDGLVQSIRERRDRGKQGKRGSKGDM